VTPVIEVRLKTSLRTKGINLRIRGAHGVSEEKGNSFL